MLRKASIIPIWVADDEQTRRAIYRFRYKIYIEEMGKPYRNADHVNELLTDDLDQNATLLYAELNGQIVGTLRVSWGLDPAVIAAFSKPFGLEMFEAFSPTDFSFCSRLMVAPRLRRSALAANLSTAAYREGRRRGVLL